MDELTPFEAFLEAHPEASAQEFEAWVEARPGEGEELLRAWTRYRRARGALMEAPSPLTLQPGTQIGSYRLVRTLGSGGQGSVWEAEQEALGRPVALKVLHAEAQSQRSLERFEREARAGARLSHPHLVTIHDYGVSQGVPWLAMELIPGQTLRHRIQSVREAIQLPRDWYRAVARWVADLAAGLAAMHSAGVLHRDVKPQNVLLDREGQAKLSDFGLVRIENEASISITGEVAGTYLYMSPEQVRGQRTSIGPRSDVFSLGVVLYELLTLQRPFEGDSSHQICQGILNDDPIDPRRLRSRCPRDLAVIVQRMLEKDPKRRYPSMVAVEADLRAYLESRPITAQAPSTWDHLRRWMRRNPTLSSVALSLLLGLGAVSFLLVENMSVNQALAQANEELRFQGQYLDYRGLEGRPALLTERLDLLWPVTPKLIPQLEGWLEQARQVEMRLPELETKLRSLLASADGHGEAVQRLREQLELALKQGRAFVETPGLIRGVSPEFGWGVEERLALARAWSEVPPESQAAWDDFERALGESDAYPSFPVPLEPLLSPLGPDPKTGLFEFAMPVSGTVPDRDAEGQLLLAPDSALVFVLLPGGRHWIGSQDEDESRFRFDPYRQPNDRPMREVELEPFYLSKYEMTGAQWRRLMGHDPSRFPGPSRPVSRVDWNEATEKLARFGLRLPTAAEWEYAARGGTDTIWWFGWEQHQVDQPPKGNLGDLTAHINEQPWFPPGMDWYDDGELIACEVWRYPANGHGLHGLVGNVWEWTRDVFWEDAELREGGRRVARGGGCESRVTTARSAGEESLPADTARHDLGLRPAVSLNPSRE